MEITEKMKCPVYVYYELHNFYQNHRRYEEDLLAAWRVNLYLPFFVDMSRVEVINKIVGTPQGSLVVVNQRSMLTLP